VLESEEKQDLLVFRANHKNARKPHHETGSVPPEWLVRIRRAWPLLHYWQECEPLLHYGGYSPNSQKHTTFYIQMDGPATPLLGIYPKETKSSVHEKTCLRTATAK
jgi:hypothetical protein